MSDLSHGDVLVMREGLDAGRLFATFDRLPAAFASDGAFPSASLVAMGFSLPPVPDGYDPLFVPVVPPPGWTLARSDDPTVAHLLDAEGRRRGTVTYKSAHYDRRASFDLRRRFRVAPALVDDGRASVVRVTDLATGETLHESPSMPRPLPDAPVDDAFVTLVETSSLAESSHSAEAESLLDEAFPTWRDPAACWTEDAVVASLRETAERRAEPRFGP